MPAHVGLTRAEVPGRTVLGGGAGLERREIDADHADVRAVTAVAAPRRAGTVTANLAGVGRDAVRIARARSGPAWGADTSSAGSGRDAVRIARARGRQVIGADGSTTIPVSGPVSSASYWAQRGGGADAARHAVPRVARRAGAGTGHPGARAAVAGPRERRCTERQALRARLAQVAGDVGVGAELDVRRRRAVSEVERAARRLAPLVQHAAGDPRDRGVRDRQRRAEVAPGVRAIRAPGVDRRRGRGRADRAVVGRAIDREPAGRAIRNRTLGDEGGAGPDVEAAAAEVPDDRVDGGENLTTGAAGSGGGELEERPAHRRGRGGRGRRRGARRRAGGAARRRRGGGARRRRGGAARRRRRGGARRRRGGVGGGGRGAGGCGRRRRGAGGRRGGGGGRRGGGGGGGRRGGGGGGGRRRGGGGRRRRGGARRRRRGGARRRRGGGARRRRGGGARRRRGGGGRRRGGGARRRR